MDQNESTVISSGIVSYYIIQGWIQNFVWFCFVVEVVVEGIDVHNCPLPACIIIIAEHAP